MDRSVAPGAGEVAARLLRLVGGGGNVDGVAHCMTRLRLSLRDPALVDDAGVRGTEGVLGVVADDGAYQIVLGPGRVARVTERFQALVAEDVASRVTTPSGAGGAPSAARATDADALAARGDAMRDARRRRNATPLKSALRRVAAVFVPLIPALIGCGIIAGLGGLLANLHASGHADWAGALVPALVAVAGGFMSLLAVFVGINTAREFGGTPVLGGAAAAVIVFPGVAKVEVFGQHLAPGQGGVLGALGAALLAVQVEKWCRRWVPESVDVLVTPTLTVLVSGLATLYVLMVAAGAVASAVGEFATWLLTAGGGPAGFVLGGLFLPLVMLGLHQALIPIHATLIEQQGYTVLLPVLAMAGAGQVGAAAAVYARLRRNESVRRTIRSALPAGLLGIGEPLIYGVSLPLGRPFVTACFGGAVGGGVLGLLEQWTGPVGATAIGPSGWALFPLLAGAGGLLHSVAVYGIGLAAGYAAGFAATYAFGLSRQQLAELNAGNSVPAAE
ncbi:PTS transporter subunit EIIC [Streptomyces sp. NPDC051940]|uniref:PTS transporter subunit EIIC n=1 Tax=Streptomyces sp. NPDC051940 TaxID=3155675 RepID=UPI00343161CA